jgi:threonine synthase
MKMALDLHAHYGRVGRLDLTEGLAVGLADRREIVDAIKLLAKTEGIWTEPAGGTTLAATIKLIEQGRIPRDESIVVSITGNGLKTQEAVVNDLRMPIVIDAKLSEFDKLLEKKDTTQAADALAAAGA